MNLKETIQNYKWEDYKKGFIVLLGQALTHIAVDDKDKFRECMSEIDLLSAAFRYSDKSEITKKNEDEEEAPVEDKEIKPIIIEEQEEEVIEGKPAPSEETVYSGRAVSDILNNEILKEKEKKIEIIEIPTYTFKIYDSEKYAVPGEIIISNSRIYIPSMDGFEYYMPVTITKDNVVYVEMKIFAKEYPYVKAAYIRDQMGQTDKTVSEMSDMLDELVDLELLQSETKIAEWKNNRYEYSQRPKTEEQKRLEGHRQSMLDNINIRFLYGENDKIYHDKACTNVRLIDLKDLRGRENPPEGKVPCEDCYMDMLIRKGCVDDFKNVGLYKYFFKTGNISTGLLKQFLSGPNAGFRIESANNLRMTYGEDTWKIETDGRGNFIRLWHNNYKVDKKGKRHIDKTEFHDQQSETAVSVETSVHYIMDYNYGERHKIA